jgi:hypothetical protein
VWVLFRRTHISLAVAACRSEVAGYMGRLGGMRCVPVGYNRVLLRYDDKFSVCVYVDFECKFGPPR